MTRVTIIVEGPTEESFIDNILAPDLWSHNIYLTPIILGVPGHKGGNVNYARVKKDMLLRLKQDRSSYCSTFLDLYGIGRDFPGLPASDNQTGHQKAQQIEQAIAEDIAKTIPDLRPELRLIPYIQPHEFEALLFSDTDALAKSLGRAPLANNLRNIRNSFPTPEDINDNSLTAPSKRIVALHPLYKKVLDGTTAAKAIGLGTMRRECQHFRTWLTHLESLSPVP